MAIPSRGTKASAGGGTAFVTGTDILASEVNTDFDNIYNEMDNIENANIASGAAIELSKLDGYGDNTTEGRTSASAGPSGSESLASAATGEVERLRYHLKEIGVGSTAKRLDGTTTTDDCYYGDVPVRGPNLLRNANFAIRTTAANAAPDGWVLVGTPTTVTRSDTGTTEGETNAHALRVVSAGNVADGVQQTLKGIKANTKYQVGCRAKVFSAGAHTVHMKTTGASGATFGNLDLTTTSDSYVTLSGVILTDATPTDIVVQFLADANATADAFGITHAWVRECAIDPIPTSDLAWAVNTVTTSTADHYADGVLTSSGVTVDIRVPGPGYVIEIHGKADVGGSGSNANGVFALQENGSTVDIAYVWCSGTAAQEKATARLFYVNTAPVAGDTYTYTLLGAGSGDTLDRNPGSPLAGETASTYIRARAYLESGGH